MVFRSFRYLGSATLVLLVAFSSGASAVVLADAAGRYAIAPDASSIRFTIGNVGGGGIKAAFARFKGGIQIDGRDIGRSHVDITIYPESVGTGQARMDAFLKSDAVFDTANEREIRFRSTSVQRIGPTAALITGQLTARGHTFPEKFQAELQSLKGSQIKFHVTGKVFRSRYDMDVGTPIYSNVVDFDMVLTARR